MSKKQYRSRVDIMGNILAVIADGGRDGIIISKIARKTNLGHDPVIEKCEKLMKADLITCISKRWRTTFFITEKGRIVLIEIQKFQNFVESMYLEL